MERIMRMSMCMCLVDVYSSEGMKEKDASDRALESRWPRTDPRRVEVLG